VLTPHGVASVEGWGGGCIFKQEKEEHMFEAALALVVGVAFAMYVLIGSHPDFNPPPAAQGDSTVGVITTTGSAPASEPAQ
jgi:hypothetical protein